MTRGDERRHALVGVGDLALRPDDDHARLHAVAHFRPRPDNGFTDKF